MTAGSVVDRSSLRDRCSQVAHCVGRGSPLDPGSLRNGSTTCTGSRLTILSHRWEDRGQRWRATRERPGSRSSRRDARPRVIGASALVVIATLAVCTPDRNPRGLHPRSQPSRSAPPIARSRSLHLVQVDRNPRGLHPRSQPSRSAPPISPRSLPSGDRGGSRPRTPDRRRFARRSRVGSVICAPLLYFSTIVS